MLACDASLTALSTKERCNSGRAAHLVLCAAGLQRRACPLKQQHYGGDQRPLVRRRGGHPPGPVLGLGGGLEGRLGLLEQALQRRWQVMGLHREGAGRPWRRSALSAASMRLWITCSAGYHAPAAALCGLTQPASAPLPSLPWPRRWRPSHVVSRISCADCARRTIGGWKTRTCFGASSLNLRLGFGSKFSTDPGWCSAITHSKWGNSTFLQCRQLSNPRGSREGIGSRGGAGEHASVSRGRHLPAADVGIALKSGEQMNAKGWPGEVGRKPILC